jgi:nitroimidazol reductase NimA-like FMN-containing flavoprotein (pyridoxamine 5'-phosphate oxidase superfamily)
MQNRMKTHALDQQQIIDLLQRADTGALATLNADGTPYVTPVHFAYADDCIYIHGLDAGQKVENIRINGRVSFTVWEMMGYNYHPEGRPCGTNTNYHSVIIEGVAVLITDPCDKRLCLKAIIDKYTPELLGNEMKESSVAKTAVIQISINSLTGKYY